ncbi:N-acetylglucosamine-6-phosphate deacetylase [Thalassotalea sp. HSM 43]|uniref:N-acetylglucosamine-6-phosphate deacetylase n=1 Tax=Thalassotalea sp. HSM 43 TaxID=2552945 RepID=UPI0010809A01|nr:N-acetylglucosamine-6-phosphate deacetylase [Thalassotalea sp. HSM 43]QBY05413.1 N-acetylglucosamine-6-phosphate deacetylase [Thalassotalea sp. HSM 43]
MQRIAIEKFYDGEQFHQDVVVVIEHGQIVAIEAANESEALKSGTMVAGFIDVQVNGGGGALFNSSTDVNSIITIGKAHAQYGTTGFLPTLITDDVAIMADAADAIAEAIATQAAGVLGVHFEGPHLSVAKKGVHSPEFIRPISAQEMAIFTRQDLGQVIVTLAPENVATSDIETLVKAGVKVCLGHSNAEFDTVQAATDAGATGFTHLFNAMSAFTSRQPGMVGAALLNDSTWCGLIVDGHHVHYQSAAIAIRAKAQGKMMLVTDAMSVVGTDEQSFPFFGVDIIRTGDRLNAPTGELAGSCLDMASAVANTVNNVGIELGEALNMASRYPAEFLGKAAQYGSLKVGMRADLVILDDNLNVLETYIAGEQVFTGAAQS